MIFRGFLVIIIITFFPFTEIYTQQTTDIDVYFIAATEEYLGGDYENAVNNLIEALKIQPQNNKIKSFLLRIFIEAATNHNLTRNYKEAMKYLEKAKKYFPLDPEIDKLYNITKEILNPEKKKDEIEIPKKETTPDLEKEEKITPHILPSPPGGEGSKVSSPVRIIKETTKPVIISTTVIQQIYTSGNNVFLILFICSCFIIILLITISINQSKKFSQTIKVFDSEKNKLISELTLEKEKNKIQKELDEKFNKEQEKLKIELQQYKLQLEKSLQQEYELKSADIYKKKKIDLPKLKSEIEYKVIKEETDKVKDMILSSSLVSDVDSYLVEPKLEEIRERISLMAQNICEYSKEQAMKFIKEIISNQNPKIRANIVRALSRIATEETLDMLFNLNNDPDEHIKREVLKSLKKLNTQINSGELKMSDEYAQKIKMLLAEEIAQGLWVI